MNYLGLDIGQKRIGVAVSESGVIAKELCTISVVNLEQALEKITNLINVHKIQKVIVGLPKNMDGTHSDYTYEVRSFTDRLRQRIDIPVVFEDERLTTVEAERQLKQQGVTNHKLKERVDSFSAALILEQYFEKI